MCPLRFYSTYFAGLSDIVPLSFRIPPPLLISFKIHPEHRGFVTNSFFCAGWILYGVSWSLNLMMSSFRDCRFTSPCLSFATSHVGGILMGASSPASNSGQRFQQYPIHTSSFSQDPSTTFHSDQQPLWPNLLCLELPEEYLHFVYGKTHYCGCNGRITNTAVFVKDTVNRTPPFADNHQFPDIPPHLGIHVFLEGNIIRIGARNTANFTIDQRLMYFSAILSPEWYYFDLFTGCM